MNSKRTARIAVLLLLVCSAAGSQPAQAGIYNLQSILAIEAPEGLSGAITGAADYRTGNGVAYMIEYERLQDDGEIDAGHADFQHRNSSYLVGHYQLDSRVQLIETVYVQPRLTDVNDTRLLSDSQVTFQLTSRLSFATSFSLAYDSRPPATIKRLDTALVSSLTLEL